jgi:sigma-B regulation protein RsbU (phosphoserine phosphatase)
LTGAAPFCKAPDGIRLVLREAAMIRVPRIAIVAFAVLIAVLGVLGFRDFTRSPYTGIQHYNLVIRAVEASSPGREAGLAPGDRILKVNGVTPRNINHYGSLVASDRELRPLAFTVVRGDSTFLAEVRCSPQPTRHVSGKFSLLVVGLIFILAGLVVITKRPDILGVLFTLNCFIFSFLMTERPVTGVPLFHIVAELVYDFLFIFLPAFFLHFFLLFPGREIERGTRRARLLGYLYLPPAGLSLSTFVLALWQYSGGAGERLGSLIDTLNALTVVYWVVYIIVSLAVFIRTYVVSEKVLRLKFRIVIVGVALGIVPITVLMLVKQFQPAGEVPARYLWSFFLSFMPISFAYAILKHDAFDLGIVARKSLVYAILLVFVVALYYTLVTALGQELKRIFGAQASFVTGMAVIIAAFAIVPARSGVQMIVDRAFYKSRKVFQDEVISFSRQIQYLLSLEDVLAFVTKTMVATFHAEHAHLFLREAGGNFTLRESSPSERGMRLTSFPPGTDLIAIMREERLPLMLEYFDRLWIKNNLDRISRELVAMAQASVAVPLLEQDEFLGFVLIARKSSGKPYTRSDAEILELLGERSAAALMNIRLCRDSIEKERLDEELRLASDIQARLLPESPPPLRMATLVGGIQTSREVGGDFYDYLELEPGKIGIAVADVSGKGIPAALLMTTLQASFRAEAVKSASPAAVVTALNTSLYERSDPEKFATLFYAIYEDASGIVNYSNAGSYPPFILTVDGRINRLQSGGVLIGVEAGSAYREGILKLRPGDLLVIYTDGFIDQENADGQPFGETRLIEFFRNNLHLSVNGMIEKLFATAIAFGQSNLKDDMTVVLLRRNIL